MAKRKPSEVGWKRNVWTGSDILDVEPAVRITRNGLYRAEFWGDYSLAFPKYGPWRKTLQQAKKDVPALRQS